MTDILAQLAPASWREVEFPLTSRDYGFRHEQARHKVLFRDDALIESLGRENPTYSYTIPFREDIVKGPYRNLFTVEYPKFLDACHDRSPGPLGDPVHGTVICKCVSLSEKVDPTRRDGVDVAAEFIVAPDHSRKNDLGTVIATLAGAENLAGLFDADVAAIDWEQEEPPEPTVDPFDALSSIENQLDVAGSKVNARMHDVAFRAEKAVASIDRLKNPNLAPTRVAARRLQAAALAVAETATGRAKQRQIRATITTQDSTVGALAQRFGMSMGELLKLNPGLARSPRVPSGTVVRYYVQG